MQLKIMKKSLLLVIVSFLCSWHLWSQNTCTDQLRLAQTRFDEGSLDEIPLLIDACMKDGFTNEEKTNAYKLLIQTYLFNELPEKADEVMMLFLREFPSYTLAVNDPKEFINLYNTYRTTPIMKIQITLGMPLTSPMVIEPFGINNLNADKAKFSQKVGGMLEINYINKLYKSFDYSIGSSFSLLRYGYLDNPYPFTEVKGTASDIYIGLPLSVRYNYKFRRINLFAKTGIEPAYLLSSRMDLTRNKKNVIGAQPYTGTENLTTNHRQFDFRPIMSMGIGFKLYKQDFLFTVGMKFGTRSVVNPDKILNSDISSTLALKYYYVEDKMTLNQTYFSFSYIFSVYKPKKLQ